MGHDCRDGRVGALDDGDQTDVGGALEIRRETGDVMRTANDHRPGAAGSRHLGGAIERTQCKPRPGQALAVPHLRGCAAAAHARLARRRHPAIDDLVEIGRKQRQPVRRVSEQVAVEQHIGDVPRDVVAHASVLEEVARENTQLIGAIAPRNFVVLHREG